MTTRTLVFDGPYLLGFEHTRALIERVAKGAVETYPPYNVEQIDDDRVRITLAVAGFALDQLQIVVEDRQLIVTGRRDGDAKEPANGAYLHRGIAARGFVRAFVLADGMQVEGAVLEHGLLNVDVFRPTPQREAKTIPIRSAG